MSLAFRQREQIAAPPRDTGDDVATMQAINHAVDTIRGIS